jgi:hypothetical protein
VSDAVIVRRYQNADAEAYRRFLASHPETLLYHSLEYKELLEDLLGCTADYWLAWDGDGVVGILPVMWRDGAFGRVVNSLPFFGSHGGPLAASPAVAAALCTRFDDLCAAPDIAAATLIEHPFAPIDAVVAHDLRDERIGQFTPLGDGVPLAAAIDGSARRNVGKANRFGVTVAVENDAIAFLEKTHDENMAVIGGRPKPPEFFARLSRHFVAGRDYRIYLARRDEIPLAALLLLYCGRTVEYFTPASTVAAREHQPMALILSTAMEDAAARGYVRWNWGGTWRTQQGVYRFKRKWGAIDAPYRYFTRLNDRRLLSCRPAELLAAYPGFFTVPFSQLSSAA